MRLEWNKPGERIFETGVSHGVLYPSAGPGVPWNGIVQVTEDSTGGDVSPLYLDGVKYMDVVANEDFEATLEAYSAPPEFAACEGIKTLVPGLYATQQRRKTFGLSYRTLIGNDLEGTDYGYKLHIVYGCTAAPAGRSYQTLGDRVDIKTKSWSMSTVPQPATNYKPTAHFILDSTKMDSYLLEEIESFLYGRDDRDSRLLSQSEILDILANPISELIEATI
jgi:hypothetical protein